MSTAQLLKNFAEHWNGQEAAPAPTLLRLSILRDLSRDLHALKSQRLADGNSKDLQSLIALENRIDDLRDRAPLNAGLSDLLEGRQTPEKSLRVLPNAVFACIPKEKFTRQDRLWEAALGAEGIAEGWRLWRLSACIRLPMVEKWHARLKEDLWAKGIPLFAEAVPAEQKPRTGDPSLWFGRWTVLLHPSFKKPFQLQLDFSSWPGHYVGKDLQPKWRLLFSPPPT